MVRLDDLQNPILVWYKKSYGGVIKVNPKGLKSCWWWCLNTHMASFNTINMKIVTIQQCNVVITNSGGGFKKTMEIFVTPWQWQKDLRASILVCIKTSKPNHKNP